MVDIFNLQRRTERYEFVDGIRSFHTAVSTLILGIFGWIILDLPNIWLPPMQELSRWQGRWVAAAIMFIIPGGLVFLCCEWRIASDERVFAPSLAVA